MSLVLYTTLALGVAPDAKHVKTLVHERIRVDSVDETGKLVSKASPGGSDFPATCDAPNSFCAFYVKYVGDGSNPAVEPMSWHRQVGEYALCGQCGDETCEIFDLQQRVDRFINTKLIGPNTTRFSNFKVIGTKEMCQNCSDWHKPQCMAVSDVDESGITALNRYSLPIGGEPEVVPCKEHQKQCKLSPQANFMSCVANERVCCQDVLCAHGDTIGCHPETGACFMDPTWHREADPNGINILEPVVLAPPSSAPQWPPPPSPPKTSCFAADTTTACRVPQYAKNVNAEAAFDQCYYGSRAGSSAAAERVAVAALQAGERVLTRDAEGALAVTRVVVNQHSHADVTATVLRIRMVDGSSISLTEDHALFMDGELRAARDVAPGARLLSGRGESVTVARVTLDHDVPVVNPVTTAGTLLVSDRGAPVLAASHPLWIAPLAVHSCVGRAVVNAVAYVVGDHVHGIGEGVAGLMMKLVVVTALASGIAKVLGRRARTSK